MDIVQSQPYDLVLRGGRVIDPAQGIDGILDVAVRDGRSSPSARPCRAGQGDDRCPRQAGAARPDRHPRPRLSLCQRPLRPRCRHGGRPFRRDHGGRPGRALGADLPGLPRIHRQARRRPACWPSSRPTWWAAWRGTITPSSTAPTASPSTTRCGSRKENADLVRGVKGHAEIGGFTRWGDEAMKRAAEIGARARPAALHPFRPALAAAGRQGIPTMPTRSCRRCSKILRPGDILAHPFTRHPGGFVDQHGKLHPVVREALAQRAEDRRRPRLALLVQDGAAGARCRHRARHAGRRHARLQHDHAQAARHARRRIPTRKRCTCSRASQNFSLTSAMTSMLALGLTLEQVVPMVTSKCAEMLGMRARSAR